MPVYTPVGGSWLNMDESIQRVLKRRALDGQHRATPEQVIARIEAAARHWDKDPTPFEWGGKRKRRRDRQRELVTSDLAQMLCGLSAQVAGVKGTSRSERTGRLREGREPGRAPNVVWRRRVR